MVRVKATVAYPYGDRSLKAGDEFEASEADADLLKKLGRAVDVLAHRPTIDTATGVADSGALFKGHIETSDLSADDTGAPAVDEKRPKRHYRRRDLTADPS